MLSKELKKARELSEDLLKHRNLLAKKGCRTYHQAVEVQIAKRLLQVKVNNNRRVLYEVSSRGSIKGNSEENQTSE